MNQPSDLSVTTLGQRKLRTKSSHSHMRQTTVLVLADLVEDSHFFLQNSPRPIPVFAVDDVHVGPELGRGEFGIVLEIADMGVPSLTASCRSVSFPHLEPETIPPLIDPSPLTPPKSIIILPPEGELDFHPEKTGNKSPAMHTRVDSVVTFLDNDQHDDDHHSSSTEHDHPSDDEADEGDQVPQPKNSNENKAAVMKRSESRGDETVVELQKRLVRRVLRDGKPRYALKRLKQEGANPTTQVDAALDLACEARFLQHISHSNIIRLRATVGVPGTATFGLVLDKLNHTLEVRIASWRALYKKSHAPLKTLFQRKKQKETEHTLYAERIVVALDIARALRHLHRRRVLYRDLKPDNLGFNCRDDIQIFDFGLAKELKPKDLVRGKDGYEATGLTGSRRYMAPEVVRCMPYGFSADVFSFAILFWQIFALETPFANLDPNKHYEHVVEAKKRPHKIANVLPSQLHQMMEQAWSDEADERPSFQQICTMLQADFISVSGGPNGGTKMMDRSTFLSDRSVNSTGGVSEE